MSPKVLAEDLLVLARQCKLSPEEERRFEITVQSSRELESLYEAGVQFDDDAGLLSGDELRFSRLVERTLARIDQSAGAGQPRAASAALPRASRATPTALVTRYFAASLAVGLLLCVTLASAWDYVEKRAVEQAQQKERALQLEAIGAARRRAKARALARSAAPSPLVSSASALPERSGESPPGLRLQAPLGQPHPAAALEEQPSASELFLQANELRRKGDIEAALALYQRLGQAYPRSVEAEDAKVLSGNLLLSQRSPRAALREFEAYHSGALSLEALWGRAQALRKLASPDERATLSELVHDYPNSPYADAAEKRLRELTH